LATLVGVTLAAGRRPNAITMVIDRDKIDAVMHLAKAPQPPLVTPGEVEPRARRWFFLALSWSLAFRLAAWTANLPRAAVLAVVRPAVS